MCENKHKTESLAAVSRFSAGLCAQFDTVCFEILSRCEPQESRGTEIARLL